MVSRTEIAEIVRQAFLAINRDDEEDFLARLHPKVRWVSGAAGLMPPRVWEGRDAVREGRRQATAEGNHVHTTLQEITTQGDRVLVFGVVTTEAEHRGRLTLPMAWIWQVRDGSVIAVESFPSRTAALRTWETLSGRA